MTNQYNKTVALIETKTCFGHRARAGNGVYSGSKYRFCVPQNRLTERGAAGYGSGKEAAR